MQKTWRDHLFDLLKGAAAAAGVGAATAVLQYFGTHVPGVVQACGTVAAAVAGVKFRG